MGRKKKKAFIDRKNASTYHLVRRSQRDIGGYTDDNDDENNDDTTTTPSEFVLLPDPNNNEKTNEAVLGFIMEEEEEKSSSPPPLPSMIQLEMLNPDDDDNDDDGGLLDEDEHLGDKDDQQQQQEDQQEGKEEDEKSGLSKVRRDMDQLGLIDSTSTYDYSRHTLPITGTGTFLSANNNNKSNNNKNQSSLDPRSRPNYEDEETFFYSTIDYEDDIASLGIRTTTSSFTKYTTALGGGSILEVDRQLDSIALTPDCMDPDVAHALFDEFDQGEYEEILDDFCITASMDPSMQLPEAYQEAEQLSIQQQEQQQDKEGKGEEEEGTEEKEQEFDYDAHIRRLMERAKKKDGSFGRQILNNNNNMGTLWEDDNDSNQQQQKQHDEWNAGKSFFQNAKPLRQRRTHGYDDDDEDKDDDNLIDHEKNKNNIPLKESIPNEKEEEEDRAMTEKFLSTLAEYDSDDVGDLDAECEEIGIRGRPLEGDTMIDAALHEYLIDKRDRELMMGGNNNDDGTIQKPKKKNQNVELPPILTSLQNNNTNPTTPIQDVLAEANIVLSNPELPPPEEDVLFDGAASYFSEKQRNPWDCESVLSTYSNLDNNPSIVGRGGSERRRGRGRRQRTKQTNKDDNNNDAIRPIVLSNKTGLPITNNQNQNNNKNTTTDFVSISSSSTIYSMNRGQARNKHETKEERRARKTALKMEKRYIREEKKIMKEAFETERSIRLIVKDDDIAGKSVFRYS